MKAAYTMLAAVLGLLLVIFGKHISDMLAIVGENHIDADNVYASLVDSQHCASLMACDVREGDILLRRYITQRTWIFDTLLSPFFTHAAYYAGDTLIEAGGWEQQSGDEISEIPVAISDWANSTAELTVILRPRYRRDAAQMSEHLRELASDDRYTFGFSKSNPYRLSCAQLIYEPLTIHVAFSNSERAYVTPDALFALPRDFPTYFTIAGYIDSTAEHPIDSRSPQ